MHNTLLILFATMALGAIVNVDAGSTWKQCYYNGLNNGVVPPGTLRDGSMKTCHQWCVAGGDGGSYTTGQCLDWQTKYSMDYCSCY